MEQTLGKRIAENRRRLGLTQDQLAERLGVTAQAVSKWENNQSCPDINTLPLLAEIFGITTDELLGKQPSSEAREAEVVSEKEQPRGKKKANGNFTLEWGSDAKNGVGLAVWVLLTGGLLLLSNLMNWGAEFWSILWPSGLLVFGLFGILPHFSFFRLGCALFGGYFLINNLGFLSVSLGKEYLLPVLLVLLGLSLLVDAIHKKGTPLLQIVHDGKDDDDEEEDDDGPTVRITHDGKGWKKTSSNVFAVEGETFVCAQSFGEDSKQIFLPRLSKGRICNSFGTLTVDLCGCEEVAPECGISVESSFGELTIRVPRRFRVENHIRTSFGSVRFSGQQDPTPQGVISMNGNVSFGEICVEYI